MQPTTSRRVLIALWVAVAVLVIAVGSLTVSRFMLSLRLAFAEDQTAIFEEMREKAMRSKPHEAAACLEYAVNYYPSGTKQVAGSRLDVIVERARSQTVADIIAHLRRVTGEDLGDDPRPWVEKYAGR